MKNALVFNPKIKQYSFGRGHPFTSERFENFLNFARKKFPDFKKLFQEISPETASEDDLRLVHTQEYIDIMKKASQGKEVSHLLDYTTPDNLNPFTGDFPRGIHDAAKIAVGTSLEATELVWEGKFKKAFSLGGGLHHAKPDKGEGFCIYNDVAICAKKLLKKGAKRVLILDTDAHAGNGTAEIFQKEERVLLIDFHQDPSTLYPGTGFVEQIGKGPGEGFTVNIALPPKASDQAYHYAFQEIVFPLVKEFNPEIIIRNGGSDPYFADGLTHLGLTMNGLKMVGEQVRLAAENSCQGKVIDLIASGYNQKVLPLAWSAIIAGVSGSKMKIKEPRKPSFSEDSGLEKTKRIVEKLKENLKPFWKCFK